MEEKFVASMVLAGVGDAMGYKSGDWEFCRNGKTIHEDMMRITKASSACQHELICAEIRTLACPRLSFRCPNSQFRMTP